MEINLRKMEEVYYFFAEILSMCLLCFLLSDLKDLIRTSLIFWSNKYSLWVFLSLADFFSFGRETPESYLKFFFQ